MQIVQMPKTKAGNSQRHQYCWMTMELFAPVSMLPHVGVGGEMPKPM